MDKISKDITICIACHPPYLTYLYILLNSIQNGTMLPYECVIGLSETSDVERVLLDETMKHKFTFPIKILNCSRKCNQAENRNRAMNHAKTKYITICDADDIVHHRRLEIVVNIMNKYDCVAVLHSFIKTTSNQEFDCHENTWKLDTDNLKFLDGTELYDLMKKTEGKHLHLPITNCHHAYITMRRIEALKLEQDTSVQFYRSEDSKFVRDILKHFGRDQRTMMFVNIPLVLYR